VCLFNLNSEGSHCGQVAEGRAGVWDAGISSLAASVDS
jgi:hypothetical protein